MPIWKSTGNVFQVAPFIDAGTVWSKSTPSGNGSNTLLSTGLGLQWRTDNLSARLDWGIPLINIPGSKNSLQDNGLYFCTRVPINTGAPVIIAGSLSMIWRLQSFSTTSLLNC